MTFFGKIEKRCSHQIYLSSEVFCASNRDRMPKLRPREVDVPIYPDGAHSLALHLLGLGFWMFRVFHCFSIINRSSSLIVTRFRGMHLPHLFLQISYHCSSQFISILYVSIFQFFDINDMMFYFFFKSMFMFRFVLCFVPT